MIVIIFEIIAIASTTKQAKYAIQCLNAIIADENEKMKVFGEIIDQIKVWNRLRDSGNTSSLLTLTIGQRTLVRNVAVLPLSFGHSWHDRHLRRTRILP